MDHFHALPAGAQTALTSADQAPEHFSPLPTPFVAKFKHYAEKPLEFSENQQMVFSKHNQLHIILTFLQREFEIKQSFFGRNSG